MQLVFVQQLKHFDEDWGSTVMIVAVGVVVVDRGWVWMFAGLPYAFCETPDIRSYSDSFSSPGKSLCAVCLVSCELRRLVFPALFVGLLLVLMYDVKKILYILDSSVNSFPVDYRPESR